MARQERVANGTYLGEATTKGGVEQLSHLSDTKTLLELGNGIADIGDQGPLGSCEICQQHVSSWLPRRQNARAGAARAEPARARAATMEKRILMVIRY